MTAAPILSLNFGSKQMNIFISYSSTDRTKAEEIALALEAQGHDVFFDKTDLSGGEDFNEVIRRHIETSNLLIFLITPNSVRAGGYALTELRFARDKWDHPKEHVLPVLLEPTHMEDIPAYLRSVTMFKPEGNAAAEIAAHVARRSGGVRKAVLAGAVVTGVLLGLFLLPPVRKLITGDDPSFTNRVAAVDFVSRFVLPIEEIERTEYSLDPTSSFPQDGEDVVTLERLAFGVLQETGNAFKIEIAITNTTDRPILLDLTHRFFVLEDDQGRKAELLYFCCHAAGEDLGPGQRRQIQLIFHANPEWEGKEVAADQIYFRVTGLLPLVRGTWTFLPLATAA